MGEEDEERRQSLTKGSNNQPRRKAPNIGNRGAGVQDREQALPVKVSRTMKKRKIWGNERAKIGGEDESGIEG